MHARTPTRSTEQRRIDACLQACQGIPIEALESGALRRALEVGASKLCDLANGWPQHELCESHEDTMQRLHHLGVVDGEGNVVE